MACCQCFKKEQNISKDAAVKKTDELTRVNEYQNLTQSISGAITGLTLRYNGGTYSLMGNLKTIFIEEKGFFYHTIVYDENQRVQESVCYSMLSLRENDQLLDVKDNDVTLLSHDEVLQIFKNLPLNEQISMVITREDPDDKKALLIIDIVFQFMISTVDEKEKLLAVVTSACVYDVGYKPKDRTVVMKKISTTLYLQLKKDTDDVLVFQQLVSPIPKPICDYIESHFIEKRSIVRAPRPHFNRRYYAEENSHNMTVKSDGYLTLISPATPGSVFEIKTDRSLAFRVLLESDTSRAMRLEKNEGWFRETNIKPIGGINQDFRFDIYPLHCTKPTIQD